MANVWLFFCLQAKKIPSGIFFLKMHVFNTSCHENSHAVCGVTLPYSSAGAHEIVTSASFEEMNSDSYVKLILTSFLAELRQEKIHKNLHS